MAIQPQPSLNHPPYHAKGGDHTASILQTSLSVAILVATLFIGFSPGMFSSNPGSLVSGWLASQPVSGAALQATQGPGKPIGIVSGHWGNGDDPGAVCP